MNKKKTIMGSIPLLMLLALGMCLVCGFCHKIDIQTAVTGAAQAAVANNAAAKNLEYIPSGLDLTVRGLFDTQTELDSVKNSFANWDSGLTSVNYDLKLREKPAAPAIAQAAQLSDLSVIGNFREDKAITLTGQTATEAEKISFGSLFSEQGYTVTNNLKVLGLTGLANWKSEVEAGITKILPLDTGFINVKNTNFAIGGETFSKSIKTNAVNWQSNAQSNSQLFENVSEKITVLVKPEIQAEIVNCQTQFNDALAGFGIQFASGSAKLKPKSVTVLKNLGQIAQNCPNAKFSIEGHTDSQGNDDYNLNLSQKRTDSVKSVLINNGANNEVISTIGYGETKPIADNATPEGRKQNRRIEIIVSAL